MAHTVSLCLIEGQRVWFRSHSVYAASEYVKVTSVERLWAVLDNGHRCNRHTGEVDGGAYPSPATVYCSEEDYQAEVRFCEAWRRLQRDIARKGIPLMGDVSRRDILKVRHLLRLDD